MSNTSERDHTLRALITIVAVGAVLLSVPFTAVAQDHGAAPYAGFETRAIKSLSDDDIDQLRRGAGWGLALPAELNGKPGPAHLLEHKEALELTPAQVDAITEIYNAMRTEAIATGERLIAAEAALSAAFEGPAPRAEDLAVLIGDAEAARSALRMVHLSRHLETSPLLSEDQIATYQVLRGYAEDPCLAVPEGHDAAMWKKHNGCT